VSTFSGKSIFGQDGPKYQIDILKQTICREISKIFFNFSKQNTIQVSHNYFIIKINQIYLHILLFSFKFKISIFYSFLNSFSACIIYWFLLIVFNMFLIKFKMLLLVIKFVYSYNPQITKARFFYFLISKKLSSSIASNNKKNKSKITLNYGLSMWVGISEAICLLLDKLNLFCGNKWGNRNYYFILNINYLSYLFFTNIIFFMKMKINKIITVPLFYFFKVHLRNSSTLPNSNFFNSDRIFNQWLAGLIDGDGCFLLSKKGYASLEIVMEIRDKNCLYQIKQKFGGSIKLRSGVNWLRYRLHHKAGILSLISAINGEIRNPVRLLQLNKICQHYNISLIQPRKLEYFNGWFSGIFDSDGSVYMNLLSSQLFITVSQKNRFILDLIKELYGGEIYIQKSSFKWTLNKKSDILEVLNYFYICPSRSAKNYRLKAIKRYHELKELKSHLASDNSILGKLWKKFLLRWDKWEKID